MRAAGVPGLVIAAPASGSGKTLVTLGVLRALADRGQSVAGAKVGPDYIDPAFHAAASRGPAINLDAWAMRPATLARLVRRLGAQAGLVVAEGVMGLFDGANLPGRPDAGSTADLAATTGWPVVLVVDAARQAASAAALVAGFARHRTDVPVAGVIFNRVGSDAHAAVLRDAMALALPEIRVLGFLRRRTALALPERHLGLVQAGEHPALETFLQEAAGAVAHDLDLDELVALAGPARLPEPDTAAAETGIPPLGQRIAVARDSAFAFTYPALLEGWRDAGATLSFFSPLADEAPAPDADAVYLPGGYPELHAGRLSAASGFSGGLRAAAERGAKVFGECGGYMVLGKGLVDAGGTRHAMAGLLPVETSFAERRLHLGYREVRLAADGPLGRAGEVFRGHEFHYARIVSEGTGTALFAASNAAGAGLGEVGRMTGTVCGSFIHLIDRHVIDRAGPGVP